MTQADRVLSTPPLNSSAIEQANPPIAPRAESVDHRPEGKLLGDSPGPTEDLSMRAIEQSELPT